MARAEPGTPHRPRPESTSVVAARRTAHAAHETAVRASPARSRSSPGPERIESGWWDGDDVTRDYFVALNADGARFWVFRERSGASGWFLHGIFA